MACEVLTFTGDRGAQGWTVSGEAVHSDAVKNVAEAKKVTTLGPTIFDRYDISVPTGDISTLETLRINVSYNLTSADGAVGFFGIEFEVYDGDSELGDKADTFSNILDPFTVEYDIDLTGGAGSVSDLNLKYFGTGSGWDPGLAQIQIYLITMELFYKTVSVTDTVVFTEGKVSSGVARGSVSVGTTEGAVSSGVGSGAVAVGTTEGSVSSGIAKGAITGRTTDSVTWMHTSDLHLGHPTVPAYDLRAKAVVQAMNAIVGEAYPTAMGGVIETPSGVMVTGDLIHGNQPDEWVNFTDNFGLDGTDGILNYPCYELRGNHDFNNSAVTNGMTSRHGAVQYRFKLGQVHFIVLDLYAAADPPLYTNEYATSATLDWLQTQLTAIGASARIVLCQHYGFMPSFDFERTSNQWWHELEADAFQEVIDPYNVIAILNGHNHGTQWPGDGDLHEAWRNSYANFNPAYIMVYRVKRDTFSVAQWVYNYDESGNYTTGYWEGNPDITYIAEVE